MKQRPLSPRRLDIAAFIDAQGSLEGRCPVSDMPRLAASLAPDASPEQLTDLTWQARGELRPQRIGPPQQWLQLSAHGVLPFTCQRCLHPVLLPVSTERLIRFVGDEAVAAQLDADMDEDVLVLARAFDLLSLIEDELIMAAPIVSRHDECPQAPTMYVADPGVDDDELADAEGSDGDGGKKPHPFAVLAQLRKAPDGEDSGNSGGNTPS